MSVKQWYTYILERDVIERAIDDEGRRELIPCKVEERNPQAHWYEIYRMSRIKGISPAVTSFNFKLVHLYSQAKKESITSMLMYHLFAV